MIGGTHYQRFFTMEERFWQKVRKGPGCWEWTSARLPSGYGLISWRGTEHYAHRVSWMIHHGEVPAGMYVLHRCDNPPCVNPDHLYPGDAADNMRDCISRGRRNHLHKPIQLPITPKGLPSRCRKGHAYLGRNLVVGAREGRRCRICYNLYMKMYMRMRTKRKLLA